MIFCQILFFHGTSFHGNLWCFVGSEGKFIVFMFEHLHVCARFMHWKDRLSYFINVLYKLYKIRNLKHHQIAKHNLEISSALFLLLPTISFTKWKSRYFPDLEVLCQIIVNRLPASKQICFHLVCFEIRRDVIFKIILE